MMRFLVLLMVTFFTSCDYCSTIECSPGSLPVAFRLLNQAGDTDLAFGPAAAYDKHSLRFYTLHGSDTTIVNYQPNMLGTDSVLEVLIPLEIISDLYMQLSATDTDTFRVTYKDHHEKCCGDFTQIDSMSYNEQPPFSINHRLIELRK